MKGRRIGGYIPWLLAGIAGMIPPSGMAQAAGAPAGEAREGRGGSAGLRGAAEPELICVTLPGTLVGSWDANGNGIVVLDARNNYNFIKRIPTWNVPASRNPEQVAGVTASSVTQMIYVATRGRLGAIDLNTEKMIWENAYDGQCCERRQVA